MHEDLLLEFEEPLEELADLITRETITDANRHQPRIGYEFPGLTPKEYPMISPKSKSRLKRRGF